MIAKIKQAMEDALHNNLFEPNDALTRSRIQAQASAALQQFKHERVIADYIAICNDANNPPYRIEHGFINLDVAVKPIRSVKPIGLVATLYRKPGEDWTLDMKEFVEPDNEIARRV